MKRTERRPRFSSAFTGATAQAVPESGHPSESPLYGRLKRGIRIFPSDIYLGLKQRLQTGGMEPIVVTALSGFPGGATTFLRDDGSFSAVTVTPTSITPMTSDRLLGRDTAGSGAAEQLTVTGGVEFTGSTGIQTSAFTGDVTKAAGGVAMTIPNNTIDNPRLADMAQDTIKGRTSGAGTGDPVDLTATQATAILNLATTSVKGLAPILSNVATEFLNGVGAYSTPAGGGGTLTVEAHTTDDTLTSAESGSVHTNEGAAGIVNLTLPAAAAGLHFYIQSRVAFGFRVKVGAGDSIEVAGSAGTTQASTSTAFLTLHLICINVTEWVAQSVVGTWSIT